MKVMNEKKLSFINLKKFYIISKVIGLGDQIIQCKQKFLTPLWTLCKKQRAKATCMWLAYGTPRTQGSGHKNRKEYHFDVPISIFNHNKIIRPRFQSHLLFTLFLAFVTDRHPIHPTLALSFPRYGQNGFSHNCCWTNLFWKKKMY